MNSSDYETVIQGFGAAAPQAAYDFEARSLSGSAAPFRLASVLDDLTERFAPCVWQAHVGLHPTVFEKTAIRAKQQLYSPEERRRRDATPWTLVQGILAPLQFLAFAVSLGLVIRFMMTGEGYGLATVSILIKTILLYTIMITGSIWEKVVFGKWLFARAFFWEDTFSMLVLGLQTAYLLSLIFGWGDARQQMTIAIAAYGVYVINAVQFLLKLRAARLEGAGSQGWSPARTGQPA
jgi:3-vinyl bacteriochlorophyllide hydratase